jgi:TetR/AcrR family transcriptional regulator, cholesterol catabolism regulator
MPRKAVSEKPSFTATVAGRRLKPAVKNQIRQQKRAAEVNRDDRLTQIIFAAAQLFCEQGYDATSMSDIGDAIGVTKAAIYHFVPGGKQDLLFAIINYGMDTVDEMVIAPAREIQRAEQRLRAIVLNHARLVMRRSTEQGFNPVTVMVDEVAGLSPVQKRKIVQRKRAYMDFVRATLQQLKDEGKFKKELEVTVAAFSLIGTIIWLGHWYRPDGKLSSEQVAEMIYQMTLSGIMRS